MTTWTCDFYDIAHTLTCVLWEAIKCCEVKGQNHFSGMIPFTRWCLFAILGDDPREQIEEERKRTVRTSMALQPFPEPCSSQIWLWREVTRVGRDVGQRARTLESGVWNVLKWGESPNYDCTGTEPCLERNLPGNIFLDCCTPIEEHDHPNDRRWDEERCIQPQPSKIQPNFLSKILPGKPRKRRKWNTY